MVHASRKKKAAPQDAPPSVLTLVEAADLLRLDRKTVEELVARGELPGRKIEEEYRFFRPALEAWLQGTTLKRSVLGLAGATAGDPYFPEILGVLTKIRKQSNSRRA